MLSETMLNKLNAQVNAELNAAYLYLSMSAYLESITMPGATVWMHEQAKEEFAHAMKYFDYINNRGGRVILESIDKPKSTWDKAAHVFSDALEHECKVTAMINSIMDLAIKESDHATNEFLQWFVREQVEEEGSLRKILDQFAMVGEQPNGIYLIDCELGKRATITEE